MRIHDETEVRLFTDAGGDTLALLTWVRQRDRERIAEMEIREARELLASLGQSIGDLMAEMRDRAPEQAEAASASQPRSVAIRRERLKVIVRGLNVGGREMPRDSVMDAYDAMDETDTAWVDAQVDSVWEGALPSDAQREGPAALPALPE
jgi:hypothetical protein